MLSTFPRCSGAQAQEKKNNKLGGTSWKHRWKQCPFLAIKVWKRCAFNLGSSLHPDHPAEDGHVLGAHEVQAGARRVGPRDWLWLVNTVWLNVHTVCWYNTMTLCTRLVNTVWLNVHTVCWYNTTTLCTRLVNTVWLNVYTVYWYNTMTLCTWPVLVHYSIVGNPCRPITRAGCGEEPYRHVEYVYDLVLDHHLRGKVPWFW